MLVGSGGGGQERGSSAVGINLVLDCRSSDVAGAVVVAAVFGRLSRGPGQLEGQRGGGGNGDVRDDGLLTIALALPVVGAAGVEDGRRGLQARLQDVLGRAGRGLGRDGRGEERDGQEELHLNSRRGIKLGRERREAEREREPSITKRVRTVLLYNELRNNTDDVKKVTRSRRGDHGQKNGEGESGSRQVEMKVL